MSSSTPPKEEDSCCPLVIARNCLARGERALSEERADAERRLGGLRRRREHATRLRQATESQLERTRWLGTVLCDGCMLLLPSLGPEEIRLPTVHATAVAVTAEDRSDGCAVCGDAFRHDTDASCRNAVVGSEASSSSLLSRVEDMLTYSNYVVEKLEQDHDSLDVNFPPFDVVVRMKSTTSTRNTDDDHESSLDGFEECVSSEEKSQSKVRVGHRIWHRMMKDCQDAVTEAIHVENQVCHEVAECDEYRLQLQSRIDRVQAVNVRLKDRVRKSLESKLAVFGGEIVSNNCMICLEAKKDTAFLCGHQCCQKCAAQLTRCHTCRQPITRRIKLFD